MPLSDVTVKKTTSHYPCSQKMDCNHALQNAVATVFKAIKAITQQKVLPLVSSRTRLLNNTSTIIHLILG